MKTGTALKSEIVYNQRKYSSFCICYYFM